MTTQQLGQAMVLLKRGYGVEDIAVRLGIEVHLIRYRISAWRKAGRLHSICGTSKLKNYQALKIMGVVDV